MKQIVLQKILDKQGNSDDDTVSPAASLSLHLTIYRILRTHMSCKQRRQEQGSWQNAMSKVTLQGTNGPWQK